MNDIGVSSLEVLSKLTALHILPQRNGPCICLMEDDTIEKALQTFSDKHLVAAPVLRKEDNQFIEFIDMINIAKFLVSILPEKKNIALDSDHLFYDVKLKDVIDFLRNSQKQSKLPLPLHRSVKPNTPLREIMELFWIGYHRVACLDTENKFQNFISQTDLLQFLVLNRHLIHSQNQKSVLDLQVFHAPVYSVGRDEPVTNVLRLIAQKNVSAVPIIDKNGCLIANFSATELKYLKRGDWSDLNKSVYDFLVDRLSRAVDESTLHLSQVNDFRLLRTSVDPVTVTSEAKLEYVLFKMVSLRVHRVWLVDEKLHVIGVISETDLMKPFLLMQQQDEQQDEKQLQKEQQRVDIYDQGR